MTPKPETANAERRSRKRIAAKLPVTVRSASGSSEAQAQTRDISSNGVFLYTDAKMAEGADVELVLILPPELTSGEKCWVCCHARVLRIESGRDRRLGVAAEIRRMDVIPEISGQNLPPH